MSLLSCPGECTAMSLTLGAGMCCCHCHTCGQMRFAASGLLTLCRAPTRGILTRNSVAAPCKTNSGSMKQLPGCTSIPYLLPDLQGGAAGRNFMFLQHNSALRPSAELPWGSFSICGVWLGACLLSPAQCFPSHLAQNPKSFVPGPERPRLPQGQGSQCISQGRRAVLGMPLRARAPLGCSGETGEQGVEDWCGNGAGMRCQTSLLVCRGVC